jgi:hypothetical protein
VSVASEIVMIVFGAEYVAEAIVYVPSLVPPVEPVMTSGVPGAL